MSELKRPDVVAVVTAFNPGATLALAAASVAGQVGSVVVVDDGSTAPDADAALAACADLGCIVVRHGRNLGIAAALNTGVSQALAGEQPRAILTLDQDSRLPDGYVAAALRAWDAAVRVGLQVAMVGPERVDGRRVRVAGVRAGVLIGGEPIQSGLVISSSVLRQVGPFDEGLFIDGVDTDFYLRSLEEGFVVVVARRQEVAHRIGTGHRLGWSSNAWSRTRRAPELTASAPFRYYFLVRNRIVLVRAYGRRHPRWAAAQTVGLVGHLVLVLTLAPDRRARGRWAMRGLRDGLRGVSGPAPRP